LMVKILLVFIFASSAWGASDSRQVNFEFASPEVCAALLSVGPRISKQDSRVEVVQRIPVTEIRVGQTLFPFPEFVGIRLSHEGSTYRLVNLGLRQLAQDLPFVDRRLRELGYTSKS